jgi:hypothetical protein
MASFCGNMALNLNMFFDTREKRILFEHLYREQAAGQLDAFDRADIQRAILLYAGGWMWTWNAYLLAAEFYGEAADYSTSDIKMLRRLSM